MFGQFKSDYKVETTKSCGKLDEIILSGDENPSSMSPRVKTRKRIANLMLGKQTKMNSHQSQKEGVCVIVEEIEKHSKLSSKLDLSQELTDKTSSQSFPQEKPSTTVSLTSPVKENSDRTAEDRQQTTKTDDSIEKCAIPSTIIEENIDELSISKEDGGSSSEVNDELLATRVADQKAVSDHIHSDSNPCSRSASSRTDFVLKETELKKALFSKLFTERLKNQEELNTRRLRLQDVSNSRTKSSCCLSKCGISSPDNRNHLAPQLSEPRLFGEGRELNIALPPLNKLTLSQPKEASNLDKTNLRFGNNIQRTRESLNLCNESPSIEPESISLHLTLEFSKNENGNWNVNSVLLNNAKNNNVKPAADLQQIANRKIRLNDDKLNKKIKAEIERTLKLISCRNVTLDTWNSLDAPKSLLLNSDKQYRSKGFIETSNSAAVESEFRKHHQDQHNQNKAAHLKLPSSAKTSSPTKNVDTHSHKKLNTMNTKPPGGSMHQRSKEIKDREAHSDYYLYESVFSIPQDCLLLAECSCAENNSKATGYMAAGAESLHHREVPVMEIVSGSYGSEPLVYSGASSTAESYNLSQKSAADYYEHPESNVSTGDGQILYQSVPPPHLQSPQLFYCLVPEQQKIHSHTTANTSSGKFVPQHLPSNYSNQDSKSHTTRHFVHCSTPQSSRSQLYVIKDHLTCPKLQTENIYQTTCIPPSRTYKCCLAKQPCPERQYVSRSCTESVPSSKCYTCRPYTKVAERGNCCIINNTPECCAEVCEEKVHYIPCCSINPCCEPPPRKPCLIAPPQPTEYCCTRIPTPECCVPEEPCSLYRLDKQEKLTVIDKLISIINNSISAFSVLLSQRKAENSLPPSLQKIISEALPKKSSLKSPKSSRAPLEESLARLISTIQEASSKAKTLQRSSPSRSPQSSRTPSSAGKSTPEPDNESSDDEDSSRQSGCTNIDYKALEQMVKKILTENKILADILKE